MNGPTLSVPLVPPVPAVALADHDAAHQRLAAALVAVPPLVAEAFRHHQLRRQLEALANVKPVVGHTLFAPTRRFLGAKAAARLEGSRVAFRHVDARLAMYAQGMVGTVLGGDTVTVVHALLESHDPETRETNPGLVRATPTWFKDADTAFVPPPGSDCAWLLNEAVDTVRSVPCHPTVGAAWFAATLMAIHPFVDGNGRTARTMFHLLNSADLPAGVDWASFEMWSERRPAYMAALKRGVAEAGDGGAVCEVDTTPFVEFAVRASGDGADLCVRRIEAIEQRWTAAWTSSSDATRAVELMVSLASTSTLDELPDAVEDRPTASIVNELVDDGRLRWNERRLLELAPGHPVLS